MKTKNDPTAQVKDFKLTVTRVINAPCEMVFRAWTDLKHLTQWFSPADIECRSFTAEMKTGGAFRIHMVSGKGDHIAIGNYTQIVPNKRLQFTWQWEHYAMPDSVVTIDFEDLGKTTRLTLTHAGLPEQEDADDHNKGWTSMVEKFSRFIEQKQIKARLNINKLQPTN